jgi:hypothetical protein
MPAEDHVVLDVALQPAAGMPSATTRPFRRSTTTLQGSRSGLELGLHRRPDVDLGENAESLFGQGCANLSTASANGTASRTVFP